MAKQLKFRGGTTAEHAGFIGVLREVTVDTDKHVLVVHDGATAGGMPVATALHTHTPAQSGAEPVNANIQAHIASKANPHTVTAAQAGAEPANVNIQTHIAARANPHIVTALQVGAEPANVNIQTHVASRANPHVVTLAQVGAEAANSNIQVHIASSVNPHGVTAAQVGALATTEVVTVATASKVLKLDANSKLPASITGDAATVGGNLPAAFAVAAHVHGAATTGAAGFMSATDKAKLDGVASGATAYVHPTTDGSHHVPATGTTHSTQVLKSGATAGSEAWGVVEWTEVSGKPTTMPASDVYAWAKTAVKPAYTAAETGAPGTTGVGASGTWPVSITGNAATVGGLTAAQLSATAARLAVFTASGSFTVPDWVTKIYVTAVAGGGGSAGAAASSYRSGGGGGGGGCVEYPLTVIPGQILSITIGDGGVAGIVGGTGGTGQSTSVGSLLTLTGGSGGIYGSSSTAYGGVGGVGPFGVGGNGSGPNLLAGSGTAGGGGGGGGAGSSFNNIGGGSGGGVGSGGASTLAFAYCNGNAGVFGGGASASYSGGAVQNGAAGGNGMAVIEW